ncbi:MAG: hypothetical protein ABIP20_03855 [Chthoniobacteraceae bacterium]
MNKTIQNKLNLPALIALVGALTFAAPVAHGQEAKGKQNPGWLQKEVDKVTVVITDLNDEQKAKLAELIKVRTEGLAKVKTAKEGGASEADSQAGSKKVWSDYTNKVKEVLNEAQFEKFKALHAPKAAGAAK